MASKKFQAPFFKKGYNFYLPLYYSFLIPSHSNEDHISTARLSSLTPETKVENLDFEQIEEA